MKYFVFLKSKRGDIKSIADFPKEDTVPFIDLVSTDAALDGGLLTKKVDTVIVDIKKLWDKERLIFVDHFDIPMSARLLDGTLPCLKYSELLREGYNLGLVTGLDRDDDYNQSIIDNITQFENVPVAFRVLIDELEVPRLIFDDLKLLVERYRQYTSKCYLILDCRVLRSDLDDVVRTLSKFISIVVGHNLFEGIVVASSSLARDSVKTDVSIYITRNEVDLWGQLSETYAGQLIYGDYATVSPEFIELASDGPLPIYPKVVYTTEELFWAQRGKNTWQHPDGFKQFKEFAKNVVESSYYRGADYSPGDKYIFSISEYKYDSKGKVKTGNAETWITNSITQHVYFVLANLKV